MAAVTDAHLLADPGSFEPVIRRHFSGKAKGAHLARGRVARHLASAVSSALLIGFLTYMLTAGSRAEPSLSSGGGTSAECVQVWNSAENAAQRASVAALGSGWKVMVTISHIDHTRSGLTGEGCGYMFFSDTDWMSVQGSWVSDGSFRWNTLPTLRGPRTPEQTAFESNGFLDADGLLSQ